jgi:hypothetical protein
MIKTVSQQSVFTYGIGLFVMLLALNQYYSGNYYRNGPQLVHDWAMSDYFAMALRMPETGFDLLYPKTYNLSSTQGIIAGDVQLPAWLSGIGMAVFQTKSAWVFRLLTLFVSVLGNLAFFKILVSVGNNPLRSVLICLLFWHLPLILYFNHSFMPSIWAFSFFTIGVAAWFRSKTISFIGLSFLLLAALVRKPYVLFLAASVLALPRNYLKSALKYWAAALIVFALWQWHEYRVSQAYGASFLRTLTHTDSIGESIDLAIVIVKKWWALWLPLPFLLYLLCLVLLALPQLKLAYFKKPLTLTFLAVLGIGICYFVAMQRQFFDHEYYFMDAFFPAFFFLLIGLTKLTRIPKFSPWLELIALPFCIWFGLEKLDWYRNQPVLQHSEKSNQAYVNSPSDLSLCGIPDTAKILVFNAFTYNQPLLSMQREGWCLLSAKPEIVDKGLQRQPDYLVCLDSFFINDVVNIYPEIARKVTLHCRSSNLLFFKAGHFPLQKPEDLFGSQQRVLLDSSATSADEFILPIACPQQSYARNLICSGVVLSDAQTELQVVMSGHINGKQVLYQTRSISMARDGKDKRFAAEFAIQPTEIEEFKIYLWNSELGKVEVKQWRVVEVRNETFVSK